MIYLWASDRIPLLLNTTTIHEYYLRYISAINQSFTISGWNRLKNLLYLWFDMETFDIEMITHFLYLKIKKGNLLYVIIKYIHTGFLRLIPIKESIYITS